MKTNKYLKNKPNKTDTMINTSVYISQAQFDFVKKKQINLSLLVRDAIDSFIKALNKEQDKAS